MNDFDPFRSFERMKEPPYFWCGFAADFDQDIVDLIIPPPPMIEIDTSEIDE